MKRRRAIGVLGGVAAGPLLAPSGTFAELLSWSERVRKSSAIPRTASHLTPPRTRVMAALAEVVIPETDTPGASQAGVTEFVAALVDGWLDDDDRDLFLEGLDTVDPAARERFGADFADCTAEQQSLYVGDLDAEVTRLREDPDGDASGHFFHHVKRFTITAYFTSEVGLAALGHRISFRTFEGCAPLSPVENAPSSGSAAARPSGSPAATPHPAAP